MSIGLFFQRQIRLIVSRLPAAITALIRAPQVFPSNSLRCGSSSLLDIPRLSFDKSDLFNIVIKSL